MEQNAKSEIVFILDQSGSMHGLEGDVVGGFNATIAAQKEKNVDAFVTTVLFSTEMQMLHDGVPLAEMPEMTAWEDYHPHGGTALLDAIGGTISRMDAERKASPPECVPAHTLVFITTDGKENSSHCFNRGTVQAMIREKTEKEGWEFVFLAANIDTVEEARSLGIREDRAISFSANPQGVRKCYCSMMYAADAFFGIGEEKTDEKDDKLPW